MLQRRFRTAFVDVVDPQHVRQKHGVEQAAFQRALDKTFHSVPASEFQSVVRLLSDERRRIVLTGGRFSQLLAHYLYAQLRMLRSVMLPIVMPGVVTIGLFARKVPAALLVSIPFVSWPVLLGSATTIIVLEALFLARPLRAFGAGSSLRFLAAFELYYLPYVLLSPLVALFSRNVVWKERTLTKVGS